MHFLHKLCCCLLFEMRTRGEQDGREEANKAAVEETEEPNIFREITRTRNRNPSIRWALKSN